MDQIPAYRVTPAHVTPLIAKRIVLVEEMIFAVEPDQAVRVVGPVGLRGEVEPGAEGLIVSGGGCEEEHQSGKVKQEKLRRGRHNNEINTLWRLPSAWRGAWELRNATTPLRTGATCTRPNVFSPARR